MKTIKERAVELCRTWETSDLGSLEFKRAATEMRQLVEEIAIAPSVPVLTVECEPDYWSGGHYHEGTKPYIAPTAVWKLPIGTKLYIASEPIDASEPEPVGEVVNFNGWRIVSWKGKEADFPVGTKFYTVPPAPAPSVPDSRTLQFLTDVLTAAGLLSHGKKDVGLATRIADESCRIRQQLFSRPPEQPAALVREAAPDIWRIMCGDWREETVAIHNSEGWIADGLDLKKAAALVEAHNGSLGLGVEAVEHDKLKGGAE